MRDLILYAFNWSYRGIADQALPLETIENLNKASNTLLAEGISAYVDVAFTIRQMNKAVATTVIISPVMIISNDAAPKINF